MRSFISFSRDCLDDVTSKCLVFKLSLIFDTFCSYRFYDRNCEEKFENVEHIHDFETSRKLKMNV